MAVDMKRKLTFNLFHVNSCEKKNKKPEQNKQHSRPIPPPPPPKESNSDVKGETQVVFSVERSPGVFTSLKLGDFESKKEQKAALNAVASNMIASLSNGLPKGEALMEISRGNCITDPRGFKHKLC